MTSFKDFTQGLNQSSMDLPSVKVTLNGTSQTLYLKFDAKDILTDVSYDGAIDPWLGSLCKIVKGKSLQQVSNINRDDWTKVFGQDQTYWDLSSEIENQILFFPLEILKAGLDIYRGRDYHYQKSSPLICRCFGVRENDVLAYVRSSDDPTPEGLAEGTKAGMGCRSCVPQLTKWLSTHQPKKRSHFFKEKSRAQWLMEMDYMLSCFPHSLEWKMDIRSFQDAQVIIEFDKNVTQAEEEEMAVKLQDFLAAGLDADLSFFLTRSRQR